MRHPCRRAGGKRPRLIRALSKDGEKGPDESGLKPSLATTTAEASERVIADPLAGNAKGRDTGHGLFPALRKRRRGEPSLATMTAEASERVIADPLGWKDASQPSGRRDGS